MPVVLRKGSLLSLLFALLLVAGHAVHALQATEVPTFQVRVHVVSVGGKAPADKKFTINLGGNTTIAEGNAWSAPVAFGIPQIEARLKGYPNLYMGGYPVVGFLSVSGVEDPTVIEVRFRLDETQEVSQTRAELFSSNLGLIIWRDENKKPHVATMAQYNNKYWDAIKTVNIPREQQPKLFPIIDRFIGGDDDRLAWSEGVENLSRAGFNTIMVPAGKVYRDIQLKLGLRKTIQAVYNPPGYAFDYDPLITAEYIEQWGKDQAKPFLDAGYSPRDVAAFAMSDEPGWYFPGMFKPLLQNPAAMERFHKYLAGNGMTPAQLGAANWEAVQPIGRSKAADLPSRKLFYWTMRFYAWDSSRHFAASTRALEKAFYTNMPIMTNFNFFSARLYVPGPVANNGDKQSTDAAMGGHDWLEFGRLRGCTMLWTEDWFGDSAAPQWSFYCAKLRCAAEKGGVQFGGYVIPRCAGGRADGIMQKILTIIGSGGKGLKEYVFGPEYSFPGNCYSENLAVLPKMAEAHAMIGKAEDVLWPGKRPKPQVAILHPRSAEMWDAKNVPIPGMISDATNTGLNNATTDYMAEISDLYYGLQLANVPTDFVEEEDLSSDGLKDYKVLYITEPNIPAEFQKGLLDWVKKGGTLAMITNAGTADRYDDPCTILAEGLGITEQPRERVLGNIWSLKETTPGSGQFGDFTACGPKGTLVNPPQDGIISTFADGSPAIVEKKVGQGAVIYYAWLPGLSFAKSSTGAKDQLPVGHSRSISKIILYPTVVAKTTTPVTIDVPMIETPLLLSDKGAAVTLLNWTGEKQAGVNLAITVPFKVRTLTSNKLGKINFKQNGQIVTCSLPVGAADILALRP